MKRALPAILFILLFAAVGYLFWETRPAVCMAQSGIQVPPVDESSPVIERTIVRDPVRPPRIPDWIVFANLG